MSVNSKQQPHGAPMTNSEIAISKEQNRLTKLNQTMEEISKLGNIDRAKVVVLVSEGLTNLADDYAEKFWMAFEESGFFYNSELEENLLKELDNIAREAFEKIGYEKEWTEILCKHASLVIREKFAKRFTEISSTQNDVVH